MFSFIFYFGAIKRAKKEKKESFSAENTSERERKINYSPLNRPPKNVIYHFESASTKRKGALVAASGVADEEEEEAYLHIHLFSMEAIVVCQIHTLHTK